MLKLERPIAFVDVEATGLNVTTDRICSAAIIILNEDLSREDVWYSLINPMVPIPAESTEKHGITDAMVKDAPSFPVVAAEILERLERRDLGGYNAPFDLQILDEEFGRCDYVLNLEGIRIIDPGMIFKKKEERTLAAAVKFYLNRKMEGAHNAAFDIKETIDVMLAQLERYTDIPRTSDGLAEWSRHDERLDLAGKFIKVNGKVLYNFGNNKGQTVESNPGLLSWILNKDFSSDTKRIAKRLLGELRATERRAQPSLF